MAKVNKKSAKVCKAAEQVADVVQQTTLQVAMHFPTPIYLIDRPDFLESVNTVSEESLQKHNKDQNINEIYPVVMSGSYFTDPRIEKFVSFVGATAWNILNEQGYTMQNNATIFTEMWTQEHHKHSLMEQHVHGYGAQIVGFYFLEVPDDTTRVMFYDPRAGKVQIDLPEQDITIPTVASKVINFTPKPGLLIFTNAWLAHAFTRHSNEKPIKFVHFNLNVSTAPAMPTNQVTPVSDAEVI